MATTSASDWKRAIMGWAKRKQPTAAMPRSTSPARAVNQKPLRTRL